MNKIQTAIGLLIFIIIIISMSMIFGNPLAENFRGGGGGGAGMARGGLIGRGYGIGSAGFDLPYRAAVRQNILDGNMPYPAGNAYLAAVPTYVVSENNDEPLYFGFLPKQF